MLGTIPFSNRRYVGNDIGQIAHPTQSPASISGIAPALSAASAEWPLRILLCMLLILYSGAWIYPAQEGFGGAENIQLTKPGGAPFNYLTWVCLLMAIGRELSQFSSERVTASLKPMGALATVGFIAALVGFDPMSSFRLYFLWVVMLIAAATLGAGLSESAAVRSLLIGCMLIVGASVLMALVFPNIGMQADRDARVWRGVFAGKNGFGWFGSIALVIAVGLYGAECRRLAICLILGSAICVLASGSKGALVVALSGVGYRLLLPRLARRVSAPLAFVILVLTFIFSAIASQVLMPIVLEALGRDPSLTGRTDIWAMYLESMLRSPWIGSGPGAFTGLSPFTVILAARLASLGGILTPHNMYLGALGDSGVIGLFIYVSTLGYLVFVAPLIYQSRTGFTSAGIGFLMMIVGIVETHEIFNAGIGGYCLVLTYSMAVNQAGRAHSGRIAECGGIDAATDSNRI
ncbi:O-antigen ligase family protein [Derxia lacustris]|uniref:O-antigen ligase family protein n=1 Tax=Derxia lacustris TaxID=764842 RepID=UPI00159369F9|nr:O-antigen ligase family protein [Derxia lacustris]